MQMLLPNFQLHGHIIKGRYPSGGSPAEWLACWTQAQKGPGSNRSRKQQLSGNSLRQTVHTHHASVHQAAKPVAALLRVAGVTLRAWRKVMAAYRRVYDSRHLLADCQEPESAQEPYARQSSMGYLLEGTRRATILSVPRKCKRVMCVSDDRRLNSFVESTATRRIRT